MSLGSENLLKDAFARPLVASSFSFFNVPVNHIKLQDNTLIITRSAVGVSSDKRVISVTNILLSKQRSYAVGIAVVVSDPNKESKGLTVLFRNVSLGLVIYDEIIGITDNQLTMGESNIL